MTIGKSSPSKEIYCSSNHVGPYRQQTGLLPYNRKASPWKGKRIIKSEFRQGPNENRLRLEGANMLRGTQKGIRRGLLLAVVGILALSLDSCATTYFYNMVVARNSKQFLYNSKDLKLKKKSPATPSPAPPPSPGSNNRATSPSPSSPRTASNSPLTTSPRPRRARTPSSSPTAIRGEPSK